MGKINLEIGDSVCHTKTFTEWDVYTYAAVTGDQSPYHIDEAFSRNTPFGSRTAHDCMVFSLTNALSFMLGEKAGQPNLGIGFDDVRFLKPVYINDTITGSLTVEHIDEERMRVYSKGIMYNQHGQVVNTCTGIMKMLEL